MPKYRVYVYIRGEGWCYCMTYLSAKCAQSHVSALVQQGLAATYDKVEA